MPAKKWSCDFESTTDPQNCYVWAYGCCEIGSTDNSFVGTSIDDFMRWCESLKTNDTIYFHNLKFDVQFIIYWLFKHGFKHVDDQKDRADRTFTTLISDKGLFYALEIIYKLKGKKVKKVTILDSMKLIPLSVEAIAKSFKLPISKLKIDYDAHNGKPAGTPITADEEAYILNDVKIVAYALDFFFKQGLNKMTIGACALDEYKKIITKKNFGYWFPTPKREYHIDVKQSYRGGFTWLNPKFEGKQIKRGMVFDVNSLYPWVMYSQYLPFGTPIFFKGKYEYDDIYPLYTQMIRCEFELKDGKIPTIQIKHDLSFKGNEYLTSSKGEVVVLCLNSVDLELFFEHYHVYNLEYLSGWKFKATKGLFKEYIDKWSGEKIKAKEEGNPGMYIIAKLYLNNLYGKYGSDIFVVSKVPYYDEIEDKVKYRKGEPKEKDGVYVAMASFITSYARLKTISCAQRIMDDYNAGISKNQIVYCDTDSLHVDSPDMELPKGLEIDSTKLGAWDHEMNFKRGKYLRQKCYIEDEVITKEDYEIGIAREQAFLYSKDKNGYYKLKITVAGMPKGCYNQVNFKNFKIGASYIGKLQPKIVPGGVVLQDVEFTIKA